MGTTSWTPIKDPNQGPYYWTLIKNCNRWPQGEPNEGPYQGPLKVLVAPTSPGYPKGPHLTGDHKNWNPIRGQKKGTPAQGPQERTTIGDPN